MAVFTCLPPGEFAATWNGSAVDLTWTGTAGSFVLRYRTGQDAWVNPPAINANSTSVSGLQPGRLYTFEITAVCPGYETQPPERITFTVPSGLPGPSNLQMIEKTATTAKIGWTGLPGNYIVKWKNLQTNEEFSDLTAENPYTVVDLLPGYNYTFTVVRQLFDEAIPPAGIQYLDKDLCCN